jgi:hypothetical protein
MELHIFSTVAKKFWNLPPQKYTLIFISLYKQQIHDHLKNSCHSTSIPAMIMLILHHMDKLYLALSFELLYNANFHHLEAFTLVGEHVISVTSNELIQEHCGCTNQSWSSITFSTFYSALDIILFTIFIPVLIMGHNFTHLLAHCFSQKLFV